MDVGVLAKILLFAAIVAGVMPAVRRQWREDRPGFIKTLKLIAGYGLYVAVGLVLLITLMPSQPPGGAQPDPAIVLALTACIVAWIFLGALWLARTVPRYRDVPAWIDRRFGPVELALWFVIAAGLLTRLLA